MANYDLTYEGSRVQSILDTGDELRDAGYIFRGEATPSTVPGTPTERVAYIGGPGTYTNFGSSTVVPSGSIGVFKYTGSAWSNQVIACTVPISTTVQNDDTTVPTGKAVKTVTDAISGAVGDEATARAEADTALGTRIDNEATARGNADTALGTRIDNEATARGNADTALQNAINTINTKLAEGYVYVGIATATTNPGTPTGKVFYIATAAGTYTNFGNAVVTAGLNVLKYNGSAWSVDQVIAIDAEPTQGSANLVKSGGVLNSIIQNGPAFDLSAYNAQGGVLATYADLSAALTALNALPADFKKGGMSIKFVLSSDNKYVQYRLMSDTFNTTVANWQGVDGVPTFGSSNLVKSGGVFKNSADINFRFTELVSTDFITGRYYNSDGSVGQYTPEGCVGGTIDLTDKVSKYVYVYLGTEGLAYICIMSGETVLQTYQSMSEPLIFMVTSEMTELRAGGFAMSGKQGVYVENKDNIIEAFQNINEFQNNAIEKFQNINIFQEKTDFTLSDLVSTDFIAGRYYNIDGSVGKFTPEGCIGGIINLEDKVGKYVYVYLGTNQLAYICIMSGETVMRAYQSMSEPLIFMVTSEMTELRAGGYVMDGKQGVYVSSVGDYNIIEKFQKMIPVSIYKGKKMFTFGDSITAGYNASIKWGDVLSEILELTYTNYAISGSQLTGLIKQVANAENGADLIFSFGGTNDWALGNVPLGSMYINNSGTLVINYDNNTFYGRINNLCKKLLEKYPTADIFVLTPLHRGSFQQQYASDLVPNSQGLYLYQYVDAIKESCLYFSIKVIDLYGCSGMNPNIGSIAQAYFNHNDGGIPDLLHPDNNGQIRIANIIYNNIYSCV